MIHLVDILCGCVGSQVNCFGHGVVDVMLEGGLVGSGGVRGKKQYTSTITFADLQEECPFPSTVVVVQLSGAVLSAAVQQSREDWSAEGDIEASQALQVDDGMQVDPITHEVTHVAGQPIAPDTLFAIAVT